MKNGFSAVLYRVLNVILRAKRFKSGTSYINPLLINLAKVKVVEPKSFVSIHVALYNERRVVERVVRACTNQEWFAQGSSGNQAAGLSGSSPDNLSTRKPDKQIANYEVILVDDSTDGTTELAKQLLASSGWLQVTSDPVSECNDTGSEEVGEQIFTFTKPDAPTVKLIHRSSRLGFKGGALQKALEETDARAEYITVFDADFVPYPDTIEQFIKTFQVLSGSQSVRASGSQEAALPDNPNTRIPDNQRIAAVQGYQWHVLNKSQTWVTRGVRTEYAGSYVIERSNEEIYGGLKQIAGSVYAIRADVMRAFGWGTSITEDFELTLRLYEAGYKVAFTPYIQVPAEAVSTVRRLIRQRMRWAEGSSFNIKVMFQRLLVSPNLTGPEKLEFAYFAFYYLQSAFFLVGTLCWFISETVFAAKLPFWTTSLGWSLVLTNLLALPLMNITGLFLEESEERDYVGIIAFIALSYIVIPFQAYAAIKGFLEKEEGPWFRTPKTGIITDVFDRSRFSKLFGNLFGRPAPTVSQFLNNYRSAPLFLTNTSSSSSPRLRKKTAFLSKSVLAVLLIITLLAGSLSLFVPQVSASPGLVFANSTYSGTGATKSITGLGFQPEFVMAKGGSNEACWSSSAMTTGQSAFFSNPAANVTDGITSLDSDGFTLGVNVCANANGTTYHYIAMSDTANDEMQVGSYSGNNTDDTNITVGFLPEMVFLKANSTARGVLHPASLSGDNTLRFSNNNSTGTDFIQNLTGASNNGFQVGTNADVNASGTTYNWVAFKAVSGKFATGSYSGNGSDSRDITAPGFNLQMVWVKVQDRSGTEVGNGVLRTDAHSGDTSELFVSGAAAANRVQDFITNGFQVGTDVRVNSSTAPTPTYHWAAWSTSLVPEYFGFLIPAAPFLPKIVKKIKDKMKKGRREKRLWKPR